MTFYLIAFSLLWMTLMGVSLYRVLPCRRHDEGGRRERKFSSFLQGLLFRSFLSSGVSSEEAYRQVAQLWSGVFGKQLKPFKQGKGGVETTFFGFYRSLTSNQRMGGSLIPQVDYWLQDQESEWNQEEELRIKSSPAVIQAYLVSVLPLFFFLVSFFMEPNLYKGAFSRTGGVFFFLIALLLNILGILWIKKIRRSGSQLIEELQSFQKLLKGILKLVQTGLGLDSIFLELEKEEFFGDSKSKLILDVINRERQRPHSGGMNSNSLGFHRVSQVVILSFIGMIRESEKWGYSLGGSIEKIKESVDNLVKLEGAHLSQILPLRLLLPSYLMIFPSVFLMLAIPFWFAIEDLGF